MITSKLPKEVSIHLEVQREARSKWAVKKLREQLNVYISARERAEQHASTVKMDSSEESRKHLMSSAEALMAGVQATDGKRKRMKYYPTCKYCTGNHWSDECTKYTTLLFT